MLLPASRSAPARLADEGEEPQFRCDDRKSGRTLRTRDRLASRATAARLKGGAAMATTTEQQNMELMQTLDDAWNAQDVEVFRQRHKPGVIVRWPGKTEPTRGIEDHTAESIDFWKTFPDQHLDNRPYRVFFASGDWTCSIARFTGTMTGPMKGPDGNEIPPTGKSFEVDFYTVAHWEEGQIVEENLMYDLVTFMKQIGLSS
jgi:hypothetical protein